MWGFLRPPLDGWVKNPWRPFYRGIEQGKPGLRRERIENYSQPAVVAWVAAAQTV